MTKMETGADYYNILKLNRNAGDEDLRKSYRRLAMIWHPDKNPGMKKEAEAKFKKISEAYDVLIDPHRRHIYDLYGEDGLKSGGLYPPSDVVRGSSGDGHGSRRCGVSSQSSRFSAREADDLYADLFESDGGGSSGSASSSRGRAMKDRYFGSQNRGEFEGGRQKATAVDTSLPCRLEDLYRGGKKKMKISRNVFDPFGNLQSVEEILTINIKPGWKKGTKITFPEKGNEEPGLVPADLIFIVDEKPHPVFQREGNDLVLHAEISLLEALTGITLNLTTLDGRSLAIEVTEVVRPGYELLVPDEGMPVSKDPGRKGNLLVRFQVEYPTHLSPQQKAALKNVFARPP